MIVTPTISDEGSAAKFGGVGLEDEPILARRHGPHVDSIQGLVILLRLCRANVGQFPLQIVREIVQAVVLSIGERVSG